ncbi:MAG: PAS domain S-box protein [Longimicrobiales bacterium]
MIHLDRAGDDSPRPEGMFEALVETSHDVRVVLGEDLTILYATPSLREVFGWSPEQRVGRNSLENVHPDDHPLVSEALERALAHPEETVRIGVRLRTTAGEWRQVELVGENHLANPAIRGLVVHYHDVTHLHETRAHLERSRTNRETLRWVATTANRHERLVDALEVIVRELPRRRGWAVGHAFALDGRRLVSLPVWHLDSAEAFSEFRRSTDRMRLKAGEGLAGRAVAEGTPVCCADLHEDSGFVARDGAQDLRGALLIPVVVRDRAVAVLEFFTVDALEVDADLRELAGSIGTQLGRVAERETARARLDEARRLTDQILDGIPNAVYLKDASGIYTRINAAGAALLGRTPDEVLGRRDSDLFDAESAAWIMEGDRVILKEGVVRTEEKPATDARGRTRVYRSTRGPLLDAHGRVQGLYGVSTDVSELVHTRRRLQERVRELETLNHVTAVLGRRDRNIEDRLDDVVPLIAGGWPKGHRAAVRLELGTRVRTVGDTCGDPRSCDIRAGDTLLGRLVVSAVPDGDTDVTAENPWSREKQSLLRALAEAVGETVDRDHLESAFVQAQKMEAMGRLAGGVAHDFNNLLTAIGGHADLLLADAGEGSAEAEDLSAILRAADRARSLTSQLLTFSRHQSVDPRRLDMGQVVAEFLPLARRLIPQSVTLKVGPAEGPVPIRMDETQLTQVLMNLVVNAVDAMNEEGRIDLLARRERTPNPLEAQTGTIPPGEYAVLTVGDSGSGIDPEVLPRIFDPFFTTKDPGRGTGLGLSMVWGAVQKAAGKIVVDSRPGEGTRFRIYLPLAEVELPGDVVEGRTLPKVADPPAVSAWGDAGDRRPKVLVVEDEAALRRVLVKILDRLGYDTRTASDGEAALATLGRWTNGDRPDVIITDLVMPRMSGTALVRALEERGWNRPVILMTGYTREELPPPGRRDSIVAAHMQKPLSIEAVRSAVETALAGARSRV